VRFLAGSEKMFLQTGDRLQSLTQRATEIISSSGTATNLETSASQSSPVDSLAKALRSMEGHLASSREAAAAGATGLTRVLERIESLADAGAEFQRIAAMLRALATSLRVEDGRRADGFGFDSVSADVVRLGGLISVKFDAILAQAGQLQSTAGSARKRQKDFLGHHGASAAGMLAEARSGLHQMGNLDAAGAAVRNDAARASGEIGAKMARILVSLQVHDITRQMVEHVIEALGTFVTERMTRSASPLAPDDASEFAADLAVLCRVQSLQVCKAREDLVAAERGIADTLRAVSAQVQAIVERTRQLTDHDDHGGSLLKDVERNVGEVAEALHRHLMHERQTFAAVNSVASATAAMETFVGEIAVIANDVKVVALNALVKAVKTGSNGAVFAILAKAIKDLSIQVAGKTELVGEAMREMARMARELGPNGQAEHDAEATETQLLRLVADLRGYHSSLLSSLVALRRGSSGIAMEVEEIARGLVQQVQSASDLLSVERALAAIAEEATAQAGPLTSHRQSRWGEAAVSRYTMESERAIHRTATRTAMPGPMAPTCAPTSDLGNNVELF
jgi:hypothetical protein